MSTKEIAVIITELVFKFPPPPCQPWFVLVLTRCAEIDFLVQNQWLQKIHVSTNYFDSWNTELHLDLIKLVLN